MRLKRAISVAQQNGNFSSIKVAKIRYGQIQVAIPIKISRRQPQGHRTGSVVDRGLKRSIPVAKKDGDCVGNKAVEHSQVEFPISVEIARVPETCRMAC